MQTRKNVQGKRTRKYEFDSFLTAMQFSNHVAMTAEDMNHHPDIYIQYNKVTISSNTHDQGNIITKLDHTLAEEIDNNWEESNNDE